MPLPNPAILQAHCAVGKILEVSGIGDRISSIIYQSEMEADTYVQEDGSTDLASILSRRFLMEV